MLCIIKRNREKIACADARIRCIENYLINTDGPRDFFIVAQNGKMVEPISHPELCDAFQCDSPFFIFPKRRKW